MTLTNTVEEKIVLKKDVRPCTFLIRNDL